MVTENPLSPERLLRHAGWMKGLAHSLVRDAGRAEDVVQQAWVAALGHPPRRWKSGARWLQRVIRNLANRTHREEYRRRARERRVARPERVTTTPADLLERAELQRRIVEAVIALDEPYRSAVLLRFFDELTPKEIAARLDVPVGTVRTRLHRALERLRGQLDGRYGGDREAWVSALLPIAGLNESAPAASTAATPGSGLSAAAEGSTASSSTSTALTIGGITMSQKVILSIGIIVPLAVGFGIAKITSRPQTPASQVEPSVVDPAETARLRDQLNMTSRELAVVRREKDEALDRIASLSSQISELRRRIESTQPEEQSTGPKVATPQGPLYFGDFADLEGIRNANWRELAEATEELMALILEQQKPDDQGKVRNLEQDPEQMKKIAEQFHMRLKFYYSVRGAIPTHFPGYGEFIHPLPLANTLSAMLERAELPLTEKQRDAIRDLGRDVDEEYARMQENYGDETLELEKMIDELRLRDEQVAEMESVLTEKQLQALSYPGLDGTASDLLSPAMLTTIIAQSATGDSEERVRMELRSFIVKELGLEGVTDEALEPILNTWIADVSALLEPRRAPASSRTLADLVTAARAQANVFRSLADLPGLSVRTRERIRAERRWLVPQIVSRTE